MAAPAVGAWRWYRNLLRKRPPGDGQAHPLSKSLLGAASGPHPEEERSVTEGLTEEELAIFDLLTQSEPELSDADRATLRLAPKRLLTHLHEKLVLDWRRKSATLADVA
jgi:type I restriction enzyme, R subunit